MRYARRESLRHLRFETLETRRAFSIDAAPAADGLIQVSAETLDGANTVETLSLAADRQTGFATVRDDYGFYGAGQTVAIIDSGIAYDHPALGGSFGSGSRVVGGWDFTGGGDANPYDNGPAGGHGTHVAGIVGSSDPRAQGVAPQVDLVALRVFDDQGTGSLAAVEQALRWVHQHRLDYRYPITSVNLSLGSSYNGVTPPRWANLEDELAQLDRDGIFVAVAAGNSFAQYGVAGLSYPAASPYVTPVMSTNADGTLSSFSQRATWALAAPGRSIESTVPDYLGNHNGRTDDFARFSGTSMAAPYLAGSAVVLREAMQFCDWSVVDDEVIYRILYDTADVVYDALTRQTYHRLNLARALERVMPGDDYGSTAATAFDLGALHNQLVEIGTIAKISDHDVFHFTATQSGTATVRTYAIDRLAPHWQVMGAQAWEHNGETSFSIVAGATYAIDLSTQAGIGRYSFWVDFHPGPVAAAVPTVAARVGNTNFTTTALALSDAAGYRIGPLQLSAIEAGPAPALAQAASRREGHTPQGGPAQPAAASTFVPRQLAAAVAEEPLLRRNQTTDHTGWQTPTILRCRVPAAAMDQLAAQWGCESRDMPWDRRAGS